jgi:hypothetical protein
VADLGERINCPGCFWVRNGVWVTLEESEATDLEIQISSRKALIIEYIQRCGAPPAVFIPSDLRLDIDGPEYGPPPYRGQIVDKDDSCFAAQPKNRWRRHKKFPLVNNT